LLVYRAGSGSKVRGRPASRRFSTQAVFSISQLFDDRQDFAPGREGAVELSLVSVDGTDELDFFEREVAFLNALLEGLLVLFSSELSSSVGAASAVADDAAVGGVSPFRAAVVTRFAAAPVAAGAPAVGERLVQRIKQVVARHDFTSRSEDLVWDLDENIGRLRAAD